MSSTPSVLSYPVPSNSPSGQTGYSADPDLSPNSNAMDVEAPSGMQVAEAGGTGEGENEDNESLDYYDEYDDGEEEEEQQKEFREEFEQTEYCGGIFLFLWCVQTYLGRCCCCCCKASSQHVPMQKEEEKKKKHCSRKRLAIAILCVLGMLIGQIILYVALSWALLSENLSNSKSSLCPGRESHPEGNPGLYESSVPQSLTFVAAILIVMALATFHWIKSYSEYRKFMRSILPESLLEDLGYRMPKNRVFANLQRHYKFSIFIDFFTNVVLTVIIYVITIFALFYMATVGKMITTLFALEFLNKLDDQAKEHMLKLTCIADIIYFKHKPIYENKYGTNTPKAENISLHELLQLILFWLGMLVVYLMHLFILGVGMWALVWVALSCKPGTQNALEYF